MIKIVEYQDNFKNGVFYNRKEIIDIFFIKKGGNEVKRVFSYSIFFIKNEPNMNIYVKKNSIFEIQIKTPKHRSYGAKTRSLQ